MKHESDFLEHRMGALEHKQRLRDARCVNWHRSQRASRDKLLNFVVAAACIIVLVLSIIGSIIVWGRCLP